MHAKHTTVQSAAERAHLQIPLPGKSCPLEVAHSCHSASQLLDCDCMMIGMGAISSLCRGGMGGFKRGNLRAFPRNLPYARHGLRPSETISAGQGRRHGQAQASTSFWLRSEGRFLTDACGTCQFGTLY